MAKKDSTSANPRRDATVQWIPGGPEIPTELLTALEDGDLVLFCGAGVSVPAGLPLFKRLVEKIFDQLPDKPADARVLIGSGQYDRALYALELACGRENVRRRVSPILTLKDGADLSTHKALLDLATSRDGALRLVTTNFDLAFQGLGPKFLSDCAPKLPVPKKERWKSLVYLHGRLDPDDPDCTNLVLTSADFGLAYLTEQWASRFVTELFRRFKVLFVGYSVEDPVMRYMMDAFAADRAIGEGVARAFALVSADRSTSERNAGEWRQKGIVPILYDTSGGTHELLHKTLKYWAERHRAGLQGKEAVVHDNAYQPTSPAAISQMCWALSDRTGTPARYFTDMNPPSPIEWLNEFDSAGLLGRPNLPDTTDHRGAVVPLVSNSPRVDAPHIATLHLAEWLSGYLSDRQLVSWVIDKGTYLHPYFRSIIRRRLPNTNLPVGLQQFWTIISSEDYALGLFPLFGDVGTIVRLGSGAWDVGLRYEVMSALTPVLHIKEPWLEAETSTGVFSDYADGEVVLRWEGDSHVIFDHLRSHPQRNQILTELADDLTSLIKRVLELYASVNKANAEYDLTYIDRPSIDEHSQNSDVRSWSILVSLVRDAFLVLSGDPDRGRQMVERWRSLQFPLFRRFVYYGMAKSTLFEPKVCLEALLESDGRWLWLVNTQRETFQLLEALWPKLDNDGAIVLIGAVLKGPQRTLFRDDITNDEYIAIVEHETFTHLRALEKTGRALPSEAQTRLDQLREKWEGGQGQDPDRDHFPTWTEASFGDPLIRHLRPEDDLRRKSDEEALNLLADIDANPQYLPSWTLVVGEQTDRAARLLIRLVNESDIWPSRLWPGLISAIPRSDQNIDLWDRLCPLISRFPEPTTIADSTAFALRAIAKILPLESEECFWTVWDRIVGPVVNGTETMDDLDLLMRALNSSSGALAESVMERIDQRKPSSSIDVPDAIWSRLTRLIQSETVYGSLAATVLASRLGTIFRLNPDWVREHFCRKLDWATNQYARGPWQGYFWQFTLPPELWPLIKQPFLEALTRSNQVGRMAEAAASWFATICVDRPDWITHEEATVALRAMTDRDRGAVARVMWRRLQQAGANADQFWRDNIGPWLNAAWPRRQDLIGASASLGLALAASSTHDEFPNSVRLVREFIGSSPDFDRLIEVIRERSAQLPIQHPREMLELLGLVVDRTYQWANCPRLRELLNQIATACVECPETPAYRDLEEYLRGLRC